MNHRAVALLAFLAALSGCVALPATPEPAASSEPEPLKRAVPTAPRATVLPSRAPNLAARVTNVSPHLFRLKDQLYITFFFNTRTGEQIFFKDLPFALNYKLYAPDTEVALVDTDVEMTADEDRFVVTLPASAGVGETIRCKFSAGLPDGRRLTGDTLVTIAPDRTE